MLDHDNEVIDLKSRQKKNIYSNKYAHTTQPFRGIFTLMFKWKGAVLKLIWHDLIVFLGLYFIFEIIYIFLLQEYSQEFPEVKKAKEYYELFCIYCSRFRSHIPIEFLTGFYVAEVVRRYWDQFMTLPFPDRLALKLVSFVPGKGQFERNLRRTVMRYVNLSIVLVFRLVSSKVHARFPNYESLVHAKLMLPMEVERMKKCESETPHEATWTPVLWALKLLQRARSEGKIKVEAPVFASLVSAFDYIEEQNRKILNYGWVNFPLAYTQVATLSVYVYMLMSIFGSQYLQVPEAYKSAAYNDTISFSDKPPFDKHTPDFFFPFYAIFEFIGYMGWIKVAEALLNPFGDDDEDFEINYLIDRNVQVSFIIVDDADMELEMCTDPFLEAGIAIPAELPYQDESQRENSARLVVGKTGHQRLMSLPSAAGLQHSQSVEKDYSNATSMTVRQDSVVSSSLNVLSSSPSSPVATTASTAVDMSNETEDLDPPLHVKRMMRMRSLKRFAFGE